MAVVCADAFRSVAYSLRDSAAKEKHINNKLIGELSACATNLSLAIELYLKTLRVLRRCSVPDTHDIWCLFKNMPADLKTDIQSNHENFAEDNPKLMISYRFASTTTSLSEEDHKQITGASGPCG